MALIDKLTAIADAIRGKTGNTDKLSLEQMATEIGNIPTLDEFIEDTAIEYENHNVTKARAYSFARLSLLEKVILPNVTTIGYCCFYNSENIREIQLPSLKTISDTYAFSGCTSLQSINLPSLIEIDEYTFRDCKSLRSVQLPIVTYINANVFTNCTALEEVSFPNVTVVYTNAFSGCTSLNKAVFDKPVGFVRQTAFSKCSALTALVLKGETLSSLSYTNVFQATPIENGTGFIYVPKTLIEEYKVATNWINFSEQFRAIEDFPEICGGDAE
jgi:hypothetical protein